MSIERERNRYFSVSAILPNGGELHHNESNHHSDRKSIDRYDLFLKHIGRGGYRNAIGPT